MAKVVLKREFFSAVKEIDKQAEVLHTRKIRLLLKTLFGKQQEILKKMGNFHPLVFSVPDKAMADQLNGYSPDRNRLEFIYDPALPIFTEMEAIELAGAEKRWYQSWRRIRNRRI